MLKRIGVSDLRWPLAYTRCLHAGLRYGRSAAYILSKAQKDVQFSLAAWSNRAGGARIHRPRNDPEGKERRSKTPLRLGCRPAGTSLMSLGVDYVMSESLGRVFPNKVYATLEFRACRVIVVQPLQG